MKSQLALEPFINYCKKETLSFLRQCFIDVGGAGDNHFIWRWHANIFPMRNTTSSAAKYLNISFICTQVKRDCISLIFILFAAACKLFSSSSLSLIHFYIIFLCFIAEIFISIVISISNRDLTLSLLLISKKCTR